MKKNNNKVNYNNVNNLKKKYSNLIQDLKTSLNHLDFKHYSYNNLAYMCDIFGSRLMCSQSHHNSLNFLESLMKKEGFDNIRQEIVKNVTHWIEGKNNKLIITIQSQKGFCEREFTIPFAPLTNSIGTKSTNLNKNKDDNNEEYNKRIKLKDKEDNYISGEVLTINSFEDLKKNKDKIKNKIIVFNQEYKSYEQSFKYRYYGPKEASKFGAKAALIRSVTNFSLNNLHTGIMDPSSPIPGICITSEDANMLDRITNKYNKTVKIYLKLNCQTLKPSTSFNIIGEIKGSTLPSEIVLVGGHSDTHTLGTGAQDDGVGLLSGIGALRVLKRLGYQPKRTIRFIGWTGEEFNCEGALQFYNKYKKETDKIQAIFEADMGLFKPLGLFWSIGNKKAKKLVKVITNLLQPFYNKKILFKNNNYNIIKNKNEINNNNNNINNDEDDNNKKKNNNKKNENKGNKNNYEGNSDDDSDEEDIGDDFIMPDSEIWFKNHAVPLVTPLTQNENYFYFHHSHSDRVDYVNPDDLDLSTHILAALLYILADFDKIPQGFF